MCSNTSTDLSCYLHLHCEQLLLITEILIMMITLVQDAQWGGRLASYVIAKFRLTRGKSPEVGPGGTARSYPNAKCNIGSIRRADQSREGQVPRAKG
jgi:hypothetical protein